jgi:hypothetical protein
MTQDEIIEIAKEAGCIPRRHPEYWDDVQVFATPDVIQAFAKLVAAKEREACAKECWKQMGLLPTQAWTVNPYEQCIDAIRARGQA